MREKREMEGGKERERERERRERDSASEPAGALIASSIVICN